MEADDAGDVDVRAFEVVDAARYVVLPDANSLLNYQLSCLLCQQTGYEK